MKLYLCTVKLVRSLITKDVCESDQYFYQFDILTEYSLSTYCVLGFLEQSFQVCSLLRTNFSESSQSLYYRHGN